MKRKKLGMKGMEITGIVEMIIVLAIFLVIVLFAQNAFPNAQQGIDSTVQIGWDQINNIVLPKFGDPGVRAGDIPSESEEQPIIDDTQPTQNPIEEPSNPDPTHVPPINPPSTNPPTSYPARYPLSEWIPAHSNGWVTANRGPNDIHYIVIHTTHSTADSAISWFKNPGAKVSAHYLVRKDGSIVQFAQEKDIAYHAGNWAYNQQSIGIEHEGFVGRPNEYTQLQYGASTALTQYLMNKYRIKPDRVHIIGHSEVPSPCSDSCPNALPVVARPTSCSYDSSICKLGGLNVHSDPGKYWNWNGYMQRVSSSDIPIA